jgi:hypothetical protein
MAEQDPQDTAVPDSIEGMAENGEHPEDPDGQLALLALGGDTRSLKLGGMKPESSKVVLKPVKVGITGQLGDGRDDDETYAFVVVARLDAINFAIKRTDYGAAESKERIHTLKPEAVIPISNAAALQLMEQEGVRI